jgi:CheY-like chemotaxis protein
MQVSELVSNELGDRLFAVVGFEAEELKRLLSTLKEVGASGRALEPLQMTFLEAFDICVLRAVRGDEDPESSLHFRTALSGIPLLAVGTWRELMQGELSVAANRDFLLAPWQPEDFLLRSYRLLGHRNGKHKSDRGGAVDKPLVLVIDDDLTTSTMVASMLRDNGIRCSVARDGKEGIQMARELLPNAVLLDINMPGLNGFEVLTTIRKDPATSAIVAMMLTSRQQEMDVIRGFALGADDYLAKPFNPLELVARVERLLSR